MSQAKWHPARLPVCQAFGDAQCHGPHCWDRLGTKERRLLATSLLDVSPFARATGLLPEIGE